MDSQQNDEQTYWFVMRDLKRPNAKQPAYKQLEDNGMEVFTPMKSCIKIKNGKRTREEAPFIQDLLLFSSCVTQIAADPALDQSV